MNYASKISDLLGLNTSQVSNTLALLDEGATIPFIARYRKEMTSGLDEVQLADIRDLSKRLQELEKRKEAVLKSIEEQGKLTDELKQQIIDAETVAMVEDLYLPFKPKRRTRASIARDKGLQGLADILLKQEKADPLLVAADYLNEDVTTPEDALAGARDILAELFSESATIRAK